MGTGTLFPSHLRKGTAVIEQWVAMAGEGDETRAWQEVTRFAEDLPEEQADALAAELAGWPGRRPMPYRWWQERHRGERHPWHRLADHRVVYVDPEMLDDPDAYEECDGGPPVDGERQPDFASGIDALAVSSDLRRVALATAAQGNHECGEIWLFDAETGTWDCDDDLGDEWIGAGGDIAFSPDGALLAVASTTNLPVLVWRTDGMVRLWAAGDAAAWRTGDLATDDGEYLRDAADGLPFSHIGFSGDGRLLVAVSAPLPLHEEEAEDRRIVVAVAETGEVVCAMTAPVRGGAVLDRSGRRLAHVGDGGEVLVHDVATGALLTRHRTGLPTARTLVFAPDGETIAVGGEGAVEVIRTGAGPGPEDAGPRTIEGTCQALHWSPDTLRALVAEGDRLTVVDAAGRAVWTGETTQSGPGTAAFTPDGRALLTVDDDTTEVIAWFLDGGE